MEDGSRVEIIPGLVWDAEAIATGDSISDEMAAAGIHRVGESRSPASWMMKRSLCRSMWRCAALKELPE